MLAQDNRFFLPQERPLDTLNKLIAPIIKIDGNHFSKLLSTQLDYLKNAYEQFQPVLMRESHKQPEIEDGLINEREQLEALIQKKEAEHKAAEEKYKAEEETLHQEANAIFLEICETQQQAQTNQIEQISQKLESDVIIQNQLNLIENQINAKTNCFYSFFTCCMPNQILTWRSKLDALKTKHRTTFGKQADSLKTKADTLTSEMKSINARLTDLVQTTPPVKTKSLGELEQRKIKAEAKIALKVESDLHQVDKNTMLPLIRLYAIMMKMGPLLAAQQPTESTSLINPLDTLKRAFAAAMLKFNAELNQFYCPELRSLTAKHFYDKHFLNMSDTEQTAIMSGEASVAVMDKFFNESMHQKPIKQPSSG